MERHMDRAHNVTHWDPDNCFGCRVKTVQFSPVPFQAHYNYAVGRYVTNQRDFNDALKRLGDLQSERTGISSTYEPIHPSDLRHSPPPESPPSHLERLVAHDEDGRPMHAPVDVDPSVQRAVREREYNNQRARALLESETTDLIPEDDDA